MNRQTPYDVNANKKPTNVSVNADLLRQAKSLKINLSQVLEQRLIEIVRAHQRELWLSENRQALEDYNAYVERNGVFSDELKLF
ncbi:MAG: type II toxin-antitoxin system CcdA family antitoxin [Gammaproteobacteria bacterium]|jgi:antitoxin CcdA